MCPYTFGNEPRRLASDFGGNPAAEHLTFHELGVDGEFSDFPDIAFAARAQFLLDADPSLVACLTGEDRDRQRCADIVPRR